MSSILSLNNITKTYAQGDLAVEVLKGASLTLKSGQIAALVGPSGSGKSTLLHIAGLLDVPTHGEVLIADQKAHTLSDRARTQLRNDKIGFIYQFHHLLPEFTVLENVMMPLWLGGCKGNEPRIRAEGLLEEVGLSHRLSHRPGELSGGEQQRVAVARALVHSPSLLLADEPTGNLDCENAYSVFNLMVNFIRARGAAALIATHNPELAAMMDVTFRMEDGRVVV